MGAATQTASHDLEMKQAISFLIAVSCAGAALANVADWHNYTQTEHVFTEQVLNHFDMTDERVWAQRYFEIRDFWKAGSGPIFLHICGEYTCPGINPTRLFPLKLASQFGALVVSVEHRFFGKSVPLLPTTSNLSLHNSRQAINDLANFKVWYEQTLRDNGLWSAAESPKWILIGGSYPGALSAWTRLKFPHLFHGAHSASGVVHAILEYTQFDQQIATSAGEKCADALREVTAYAEKNTASIKAALGASSLRDGDFYYLLADSAAEAIQYGHRDILCDAITGLTGSALVNAYEKYVNNYFYGVMGNAASDYDSDQFADPAKGGNARSWWWQKCTELAYWQVAPAQGAIRSHNVNVTYHRDLCKRVFGLTQLPKVDDTNTFYGATNIANASSNIFFSNGGQDPWQWAGVRSTTSKTTEADLVDCDGCAHCVDLYTPAASDSAALVAERQRVTAAYEAWLGVSE